MTGQPPRYRLHHAERGDTLCELGAAELFVARLFDGSRTLAEIQHAASTSGRSVSLAALQRFESRLLRAGALEGGAPPRTDPFTGGSYGRLTALLVVQLLRWTWSAAYPTPRRAVTRTTSLSLLLACSSIPPLLALALTWGAFSRHPAGLHFGPLHLVALYALVATGALLHEQGHAFACRAHGVRVRELGVALYFLLPVGWVKPDPGSWAPQPLRAKLVILLAGPAVSFALAALGAAGVLLWPSGQEWFWCLCFAGWFGAVPTLLPFLPGDGYQALCEMTGRPNLRTRALRHVFHGALPGALRVTAADSSERRDLVAFATMFFFGWSTLAVGSLWILWSL